MTKHERENWKKRQDLEAADIDPKPWRGLQVHSQNTEKHEFVKFCLTLLLDQKDRAWDSETQFSTGRVDVIDLGPDDGNPVVYEVETDVTPKRKREKVDQYVVGPVRDVIVVDPADVPDELAPALAYLDSEVVLG